ncbi:N-acetyltransferase [Leucothrix sargassi]|nr:N-acetyltransferase [Leucothrix sargassi]
MIIRTLCICDSTSLKRFQKKLNAEGFSAYTSAAHIACLQSQQDQLFMVAEEEMIIRASIELSSSVSITKNTRWLELFVDKEYRAKGLGSLLLKRAIEWSRQQKDIDYLCLAVMKKNTPAINLYRNHGFKETGRLKSLFFPFRNMLLKVS